MPIFRPRTPAAWFAIVLSIILVRPPCVGAQHIGRIADLLIEEVMPEADRFDEPAGDPPVVRAYRATADGGEVLHGYVFLTSDLPPEQFGYSGPIEVLVGMRPDGTLTGVRVTDYRESYMRSMGDFLRTPGFQEQFAGKHLGDPFQVWGDVDGISRVSISVRAMSRGIRDASRRVANAYGLVEAVSLDAGEDVDPVGLSWFELRQLGVVERFEVSEPGEGSAGIALAHVANERLGEYFLGSMLYERALASAERRGGVENLVLYAIDGSRLRLFTREGWSIEQGGQSTAIDPANVVSLGLPSGGVVAGEATMIGFMLVDGSIDMARPFTFVYDLGVLGMNRVEYVGLEARRIMAEEAAAEAAEAERREAEEVERQAEDVAQAGVTGDSAEGSAGAQAEGTAAGGARAGDDPNPEAEGRAAAAVAGDTGAGVDEAGTAEGEVDEAGVDNVGTGPEGVDDVGAGPREADPDAASDPQVFDFTASEDESFLERTLAGTSWSRVAIMLLVLSLGTAAFFTKSDPLRWTALAVTLILLGWVDGGFLSVSHITSGIWAGVGVYLRDLPLLLMVVFVVVTTLVWGRVFCGFLCPFGALQDVIDRVVPRAWKRPLPQPAHDRAVYVKYAILGIIVVPALAGSQVSLYQYFEPFGTVFFMSPSLLLWTIAAAFLVASVIVPRFYCRYACPLGAALGVVSLVSLRRIRRVEQCTLCKVCEQKCPTGAIRGPDVAFHECVRCNICEIQLIEQTGVCGHDMEQIRPRLAQIRVAGTTGATADV